MGVKRYKLFVRNHFTDEKLGIFSFDEKDGKQFEDKAHCSTIDKFTSLYDGDNQIIDAFNNNRVNNGVQLNCSFGRIQYYPNELIVTHNQKGEVIDQPVYSFYKDITKIPLIDYVNCDPNSKEFNEFVKSFLSHLHSDEFYFNALKSDYYKDYFKSCLIGYREYVDFEKNHNIIVKQLGGYAMMRKSYMDIIRFDKQNKR